MKRVDLVPALKIVFAYALVGGIWIIASDKLLLFIVQDTETAANLQTYKGWFYVLVTSLILLLLIRSQLKKISLAETKLRRNEKLFSELFNNSFQFAGLLDESGKLVKANDTAKEFINASQYDLLNKYFWDTPWWNHSEEQVKNLKENFLRAKKGKLARFEAIHKTKSSIERYFDVTIKPVYDQGDGNLYIVEGRDITERRELLDLVYKAKNEAESANQLKSEFLAQVSHEIRTPVNTILSFSELYREQIKQHVGDDLGEGLSIIKSAGKRITRTIDLILNLSEARVGSSKTNFSKIDLHADVLLMVLPEYYILADEKNIELVLTNYSETNTVYADRYMLEQIFHNLIDNAIKYTTKGKVEIRITPGKWGKPIVEVIDTGIGINPEYLPHIFEPFSQEEQGYTRRFEGNGLGLSLVTKYCETHNIKIDVQSEKGKGTTFTLKF